MDKLIDYIPLVIIVVSFIVSIVKGSKKNSKKDYSKTTLPKGVAGKTGSQSSQTKTGRTIYPEMKSQEDPRPNKYETWDERAIRELESFPAHKKDSDIALGRLGKATKGYSQFLNFETLDENNDMITSTSDDSTELIDSIKSGFLNPDDLKKAVIFSEILQRKYS